METFEPSSDLRTLFNRAIEDPTSITRAESNQVLRLPPPDEEDRIIRESLTCNSKAELVSKAATSPETLTREEVDYILPQYHRCVDPGDDRLMFQAIDALDAAKPSDEQAAVANAYKRQSQRRAEERAERERKRQRRDDLCSRPRAEWVQRMVDVDLQRWGFVCFRTAYGGNADDEKWELFKAWYNGAGEHVALIWKGLRDLWPKHMTHFVSDPSLEACPTDLLRERFRRMRAAGEIPDGLRTDVFLIADERAIADDCIGHGKSYSTVPCVMNVFGTANKYRGRVDAPLLRAVDPDYEPKTAVPTEGAGAGGYRGEISYRLPKTFDWLHYTFFAQSETWEKRYRQTQEIEWAPFKPSWSPYPTYGPGF